MYVNFHTHHLRNSGNEIFNCERLEEIIPPFFSYGIHPGNIGENPLKESVFSHKNCLAVGECGLDKNYHTPFGKQMEIFKQHVFYSEKYTLPLIIHCVKSWNELVAIKRALNPKQTWIYHGFSKTNLLEEVLENELFIGLGPAIFKQEKLQHACEKIPIERLLLETDDNRQIAVHEIYTKVAEIKNLSLQTVEKAIEHNFKTIFKKWHTGSKEPNY